MGEKGLKWLEQLWQCFLSIVKILLQSKWRKDIIFLCNYSVIRH